jgi:hypothetical protein
VHILVANALFNWECNEFMLKMSSVFAFAASIAGGASLASARLPEQRWQATRA